jgi:hypothetical protein
VGQRGHSKSRGLCFYYGKETKIINWEQDFCTSQNSFTAEEVIRSNVRAAWRKDGHGKVILHCIFSGMLRTVRRFGAHRPFYDVKFVAMYIQSMCEGVVCQTLTREYMGLNPPPRTKTMTALSGVSSNPFRQVSGK